MKPREGWLALLLLLGLHSSAALQGHKDQRQDVRYIDAEEAPSSQEQEEHSRFRRDTVDGNISSVFHLNDSHLHLMVHWAGKGSSIVFCLARDQEISENSTTPSRVFISKDYGTTFSDISGKFILSGGGLASINKFFHHPINNCYYVFTDILHKHMFVTLDCGQTVKTYRTQFSPRHLEFDKELDGRFLVHDREDEKRELFVTRNFGETFSHAGDYIKAFYMHYSQEATLLYVSRMEPGGLLQVLSSSSFFERQIDTVVVFSGAEEFEMREDFLFAVTVGEAGQRNLHVARAGARFVVAEFPGHHKLLDYHVAEVTPDSGLLVIVNHASNLSNLYISDVVSDHEVQFSLALPRIMFYAQNTTWRNSWLEKMQESLERVEANFADFYRVSGLRGVYLASQLAEGVTEDSLRPPNLTTLISFDSGAMWQPVQGPKTDNKGNPILGCYQDLDCSLHIAQQLSRKYPATRSIPIMTSDMAPGLVLASGNMGRSLGYKTSVFLSADAGLSWHQVLQGNYYYNVGDHGGIIVAVKYFKTEGDTNTLLYSTDEGLTWHSHQFYPTPIRIFGLITEPGENTTVFTMFGTQAAPSATKIDWIIIKVDLRSVFERTCGDGDYKDWSPVAPGEGKASRCVLGRREVYRRRSPKANCYNGLTFSHRTRVEACPCSHYDYQCDFGFTRDQGRERGCIQDPEMEGHEPFLPPTACEPDTFYNRTKGYRRIAGDQCEGGLDTRYEPELRACPLDLTQPKPFMLVAQRKRIVRMDLTRPNSTMEVLPLIGVTNVIAMDFDLATDCVFWADIDQDKIMKQCLNDSSPPEVLAQSQLSSVEGMAYDHISQILYFVDGSRKKIELLKVYRQYEGHLRKTILHEDKLGENSKPRGIAVHPTQGYLFYSDWADKAACIGRSRLDGTEHKIIIDVDEKNKNKRILGWPNGLTVDTVAERIYFVDAQKDFLASATLDGLDFKKIVSGRPEAAHPFAVAVNKGLVLWNDWTRKAIYQADKNSGAGVLMLEGNVEGAMDMKIYSPGLLAGTNACSDHSCSHLCVAMPASRAQGEPAYTCLCPDGMKPSQEEDGTTVCRCPDGQMPLSNGTCRANSLGGCGASQWQCDNKLCIAEGWLCDGLSDCGDNSDETKCEAEKCRPNQFQCANQKCVPQYWKCDFDNDCGDGSDESDCPTTTCKSGVEFRCDNGQCINSKWQCDLEKDCQDGSDESNCTAVATACDTGEGGSQLQCRTGGACLPTAWHCDGDQDCPDNSDEEGCEEVRNCQDWQFACDNGHCIFQTWRCDGDPDCADSSDEKDCDVVAKNSSLPQPHFPRGECNEWMFKCANEQCIPFWWKCDGVRDCSDGTDELQCGTDTRLDNTTRRPERPEVVGCPTNKFQCRNGECIWAAWVCDKESDCFEGEDEETTLCAGREVCGAGRFQCELSGSCVDLAKVCDGHQDCDDGTDEKRCSPSEPYSPGSGSSCPEDTSFTCDLGQQCVAWLHKCDGHTDCVDGSDEEMCEHWAEEQLLEGLEVEEDERTDTTLKVLWWVPDAPHTRDLEYRYGLSIGGQSSWTNESSTWAASSLLEHEFRGLQPATVYDIRVFVRNTTEGREYQHAPTARGVTRDGLPGAPRQLTSQQQGGKVEVSWRAPLAPQGSLAKYWVTVSQGGNLVREESVSPDTTVFSLDWLVEGEQYSVTVAAENQEQRSPPSEPIAVRLRAGQGELEAVSVTNSSVQLQWQLKDEQLTVFNVTYRSGNTLDRGMGKTIQGGSITLRGLSPGEEYTISVSALHSDGSSSPSTIKVSTLGAQVPTPVISVASVTSSSPTGVKLSWSLGDSGQEDRYRFGVWWGVSEEALVSSGPQSWTNQGVTTATIQGLKPCTQYLFGVAVLGQGVTSGAGPLGRMSSPALAATQDSPEAPPRNPTVQGSTLSWERPCDRLPKKPIGYLIRRKDEVHDKWLSPTKLAPVNSNTVSHQFGDLVMGSRYQTTVEVTLEGQAPVRSSPVLLLGPPVPPPTNVYAHPGPEGYRVSWANSSHADSYEVVLSPDPEFRNRTCSIRLPSHASPLILHPSQVFNTSLHSCSNTDYSVAVVALTSEGYSSDYSRAGQSIYPLSLVAPDSITIPESSAVGTVVGVLLVMILLGSGLGYFAWSNRRMRSRFREFAAGHYSSATGEATLNHSALMDDDDESPIIRGFNDEEPLVM